MKYLFFLCVFCSFSIFAHADVIIKNGKDGPYIVSVNTIQPKTLTFKQKRIVETIEKVMAEYSAKNKYSELTQTQCKQMSEAIWFRLRVLGIKLRLAAGNIKEQIMDKSFETYLARADHAWVMAEVPGKGWLALESTNGSIITKKENPLYYSSAIFFNFPEEVYRFDGLRQQLYQTGQQLNNKKQLWNKQYAGKRYLTGTKSYAQMINAKKEMNNINKQYKDILQSLKRLYTKGKYLK